MPGAPQTSSEKTRARIGIALWVIGILMGSFFLMWMLLLLPLMSKHAGTILVTEAIALLFAVPACMVYMTVPMIVDRFDPEPWWALFMAFLWGALAAAGFSGLINTLMGGIGYALFGKAGGDFVGAVISAPFVEESMKGMAVLGMFWFMRREFDGVVDGVIYGIFSALGFAMTENVLYYSMALTQDIIKTGEIFGSGFQFQIIFRGILKPWGHPLYTALTGLGVGIARETTKTWVKWVAPIGFFCLAVFMHALWNFTATLSGWLGVPLFLLLLIMYFFVMIIFSCIVIWLVVREGRTLRKNLEDEMHMGNISQEDLDLICSPIGRFRARFRGSAASKMVKSGIRLGMAKWHAARAMKGQKHTVSIDSVLPLRQEMMAAKAELQASGG